MIDDLRTKAVDAQTKTSQNKKNRCRNLNWVGKNDAVLLLSFTDRSIRFCTSWLPMIGYDERELKEEFESFWSRVHTEDRVFFQPFQMNPDHYPDTDAFQIEFRLKSKKEEFKWFRSRITQAESCQQFPKGAWLFSLKDIHDQKRWLEILDQEDRPLSQVIENSHEMIGCINRHQIIEHLNDPARNFFREQMKLEIHEGDNLKAKFFSEGLEKQWLLLKKPLERAMKGELKKVVFKFGEDEMARFWEFYFNPAKMLDNTIGAVIFMKDVTETVKELQEIKSRQRAYLTTKSDLDAILYQLSHLLKGPLLSLKGVHHLMKMESQDAKANLNEHLHMADQSVHYMVKTITDLSFMESFRYHNDAEKIFLEQLTEEVIRDHVQEVKSKGVTVKVETYTQEPLLVPRDFLLAVFRVLFDNACSYRREEGNQIQIEYRAFQYSYSIKVRDQGEGIEHFQKDKVFDLFYRGNEKSKGSGVGLYLAKRIMGELGGTINLQSDGKTFTEFTLLIPRPKEFD